MTSMRALSCTVNDYVLHTEIPLTFAPIPDAPPSDVCLTLDLTLVPQAEDLIVLLTLVMAQQTGITWILYDAATGQGFRCQGTVMDCAVPLAGYPYTTMTLAMRLRT